VTVSEALTERPLALAVIVTGVLVRTREVRIVMFAKLAPAGITTLAGTLATAGLLLASATVTPVVVLTASVARTELPPVTEVLASVSALGSAAGAPTVMVIGAEVTAAPTGSVAVNVAW
jgi:hypothetical protein